MPPKKRKKTTSRKTSTSAASKPRKKTRRKSTRGSDEGSVDAGVQRAMNSFLSPEARAQHEAGEREFRKEYGGFIPKGKGY